LIALAKAQPEVAAAIEGKRLVKEIAVPGRLVNLVAV
jgi:leucyl-tRNA synthetase